jgi:hypothetical protein
MKKLIFPVLAFVLFFTFSASAYGQKQRITFKKGATSAVVSGTLDGYKDKRRFVIRVRAGQTITTEQISGKPISIWIKDPSGEEAGDMDMSCHNRREITPTVAGDYALEVVECQKADRWHGPFKFRIRVR